MAIASGVSAIAQSAAQRSAANRATQAQQDTTAAGIASNEQLAAERNALEERLARLNIDAETKNAIMALAFGESEQNPFRQQNAQAQSLAMLDRLANEQMTPTRITPDPHYAGSVPQISGGYSYERSPALRQSAAALQRSVMAGNTAPTQTNPANYGRTSALDLISVLEGGVAPENAQAGGASAAYQPPASLADLYDQQLSADERARLARQAQLTSRTAQYRDPVTRDQWV
jgi:hypothetical protein